MWHPFERRAVIEVFRHPHIGVERYMFRHITEVRPCRERLLKNIEAGNSGATGSWPHEARQYAHGGRLASAVRPQKTHDSACTDFALQILARGLARVAPGRI